MIYAFVEDVRTGDFLLEGGYESEGEAREAVERIIAGCLHDGVVARWTMRQGTYPFDVLLASGATDEGLLDAARAKKALVEGARVTTAEGPGTIVYVRMAPPSYTFVEAVSVRLDARKADPTYAGTVYAVAKVRPT